LPRRRLLLDACVAINLAATDSLDDIAEALQISFVMARQAEAEVGHLRDVRDGDLVLTPINLRSLASGMTLEITDLRPSEFVLYLELAAIVDDGEAATIAVAIQRQLGIATDDRKARRLCAEKNLTEPVRTVSLLRAYADTAGLAKGRVRELLTSVRDRASFLPPRSDPDLRWWEDRIEASKET
jgi:predicted nucleic acid-binding protein